MKKTETTRCTAMVARRRSVGILGKGTESFRRVWGQCSKSALTDSDICLTHQVEAARIASVVAYRKARKAAR